MRCRRCATAAPASASPPTSPRAASTCPISTSSSMPICRPTPKRCCTARGRTGRAGRKGICALIVPYHRRGSAARLLKLAKLEATIAAGARPGRDRCPQSRAHPGRPVALPKRPTTRRPLRRRTARRASAPSRSPPPILRQQLASRPAAEELSDGPAPVSTPPRANGPTRASRTASGSRCRSAASIAPSRAGCCR